MIMAVYECLVMCECYVYIDSRLVPDPSALEAGTGDTLIWRQHLRTPTTLWTSERVQWNRCSQHKVLLAVGLKLGLKKDQ